VAPAPFDEGESIVMLTAAVAALLLGTGPTPADGRDLIRDMHARYAGKWYRTLTFTQESAFGDGRVQTWYEAAAIPGRLRIDIAPLDDGNTIIFRNDSIYNFQGGALAGSQPQVHPLMVLGFDVYASDPAETIARLEGLGFDLSVMREDTWQGRPVYVVGAQMGDSLTRQFWVDKEHLYFVRLLQPAPRNPQVVSEIQFNKYQRLGQGWIAPEVLFLAGGTVQLTETYRDMKADVSLEDAFFLPDPLMKPDWE